jgi:transcriptional regulator with XRE-family HTH domain
MTNDVRQQSELDMSGRVAEEIRALLGRRRMTGRELARRLGVSPSWVSYRLTGTQPIDLNDLDAIAEVLKVSIVDLLPRDRRQVTDGYAPEPRVSGTVPHPRHPIVARAVTLPGEIRHGDARRERRQQISRKVDATTTSTGRIAAMSFPLPA